MYQYVSVHDIENDYKGFELREVTATETDTETGVRAEASAPVPMTSRTPGTASSRPRKLKRKRPMSATATPVCLPGSGLLSRGPKRWKRANSISGSSMVSTSRDSEDTSTSLVDQLSYLDLEPRRELPASVSSRPGLGIFQPNSVFSDCVRQMKRARHSNESHRRGSVGSHPLFSRPKPPSRRRRRSHMSHKLLPLKPLARDEHHPLSHLGASTLSPLPSHATKFRSFTPFGVRSLAAVGPQGCGVPSFRKQESTTSAGILSQTSDKMEDAASRPSPLEAAFSDLTIRETRLAEPPHGSHRGLGASCPGGEPMVMWDE